MSNSPRTSHVAFPSTRWTLVRSMQKGGEAEAAQALNEICRHYWYPIYAFTRRHGFSRQDAEDITQAFFQRVITTDAIMDAREEKGRLRSFMLAMLKRIISNHIRHISAEKRGGSPEATLSFDDDTAENRYAMEPADARDPDAMFDQAWARDVLASAESKLHDEYAKAGKLENFQALREFLPLGDNVTPYAAAAKNLGINESTLRLQIHRMRKSYGRLVEDVISQTVSHPDEVRTELAHLMAALAA